jgi:hypothetical protein
MYLLTAMYNIPDPPAVRPEPFDKFIPIRFRVRLATPFPVPPMVVNPKFRLAEYRYTSFVVCVVVP